MKGFLTNTPSTVLFAVLISSFLENVVGRDRFRYIGVRASSIDGLIDVDFTITVKCYWNTSAKREIDFTVPGGAQQGYRAVDTGINTLVCDRALGTGGAKLKIHGGNARSDIYMDWAYCDSERTCTSLVCTTMGFGFITTISPTEFDTWSGNHDPFLQNSGYIGQQCNLARRRRGLRGGGADDDNDKPFFITSLTNETNPELF